MTDKLKCPFCGAELAPHIDEWKSIRKLFICNNTGCFCWGQPMLLEIWQAVIDGKKAQGALKEIVANPHGAACHNYCRAKRVLEEIGKITSITKQEK